MLDKALSNAQERLAAKERSAVGMSNKIYSVKTINFKDAVALVDKCTHQQKLLQEALDEKQKLQEEHTRQKALFEKEIAQFKSQLVSD